MENTKISPVRYKFVSGTRKNYLTSLSILNNSFDKNLED